MLKQIQSNVFLDTTSINFEDGLNVILGDGANSIGKTSFLKIIDFAFGGNYYIDSSDDVFKNVGHHDICFSHEFHDNIQYFRRSTKESKFVYKCDANYNTIDKIPISQFNNLLFDKMNSSYKDISFRELVSLYSRIWSKPNRDVNHPLFLYNHQKVKDSILNLIKTFNMYEPIKEYQGELDKYTNTSQAYVDAKKYDIITSITKAEYDDNNKRIKLIEDEILNLEKTIPIIRQNEELEFMENNQSLFSKRQNILRHINKSKRELMRIQENINSDFNVQNKYSYESLKEFFPTVNIDKLTEISTFHEKIKNILYSELTNAEKVVKNYINNLEKQLEDVTHEISISKEIESRTGSLIEKIKELTSENNMLVNINKNYSEQLKVKAQKKNSKSELEKVLLDITGNIENLINNKLFELAALIESKNNKAPTLKLKADTYSFGVQDNTGTGKAYTDLILFDLSVLTLTEMPMVIHDSFLFNNIGYDTMGSFIKLYNSISNKQMFISVDEMYKYDKDIQEILTNTGRKFLNDTRQLYKVDWRQKTVQ